MRVYVERNIRLPFPQDDAFDFLIGFASDENGVVSDGRVVVHWFRSNFFSEENRRKKSVMSRRTVILDPA